MPKEVLTHSSPFLCQKGDRNTQSHGSRGEQIFYTVWEQKSNQAFFVDWAKKKPPKAGGGGEKPWLRWQGFS